MKNDCDCTDANFDSSKGDTCSMKNENGCFCTRIKGHSGSHHAHGFKDGECFGEWK